METISIIILLFCKNCTSQILRYSLKEINVFSNIYNAEFGKSLSFVSPFCEWQLIQMTIFEPIQRPQDIQETSTK